MVLITDDRDGGCHSTRTKHQNHQKPLAAAGRSIAQVHPILHPASSPPPGDGRPHPSSYLSSYPEHQEEDGEDEEEEEEEDGDDSEEIDFEDLEEDVRSVVSDDSFYPPSPSSEEGPPGEPLTPGAEPLTLYAACCANNAAAVRLLVRQGVEEEEVNCVDRNNRTGLLVACYQGYVNVVISLAQCPHLDAKHPDHSYLLNYFAGLDLERRNCHGFTALMKAAMQGRLEWPQLAPLVAKAREPRGCMKRLSDSVRSVLNIANVTDPEDQGAIDHLVTVTTALRSPFIALAPPRVGKRRLAVSEILQRRRDRHDIPQIPNSRVTTTTTTTTTTALTAAGNDSAERCTSLRRSSLSPSLAATATSSASGGGGAGGGDSGAEVAEVRRTSLLPIAQLLPPRRKSSVWPGHTAAVVVPKVRVSKAPAATYEPDRARRKSSAPRGNGADGRGLLQVPKWRYKEVKEERRRAEEAERRRLEAAAATAATTATANKKHLSATTGKKAVNRERK
ncbi:hypothetical protein CRUP_031911 [Coryphaenoides rupestris]|nr:hypothetical protein CRUP_031911 [Coryphaenoides rupestris]